MGRKKTYEEVKQLVEETSDCKLLSESYDGWNAKLRFQCSCGRGFTTDWNHFSNGRKRCNECAKKEQYTQKRLSMDDIRNRIKVRGAEYVSGTYVNQKSKLRVKCSCGDEFERSFDSMMRSENIVCPDCLCKLRSEVQAFSIDRVAEEIAKYGCDLLTTNYKNAHQSIDIRCSCGNIFTTTFNSFFSGGKRCCRSCTARESKGERVIRNWLERNGVSFEQEKRFPTCGDKRPFPFDFFLPEQNMCIEYDGEQHSVESSYYYTDSIKEHDAKKTQYCKDNNIRLLRIDYTEPDINKVLAMSIPR